jgi:hypothetical protein
VLVADPQVEDAVEDDDDLLVGIVRIRIRPGPPPGSIVDMITVAGPTCST